MFNSIFIYTTEKLGRGPCPLPNIWVGDPAPYPIIHIKVPTGFVGTFKGATSFVGT